MTKFSEYYHNDIKKFIGKMSKNKNCYVFTPKTIAQATDVQSLFKNVYKKITYDKRILVIYYNHFWEPLLYLASVLKLRKGTKIENWLDESDISNLLQLSDFEIITTQKRFLFPIKLQPLSGLINRYVYALPIINSLCLTTLVVARKRINPEKLNKQYSVSIIVPARNEAGNIGKITKSIPQFGKSQEIIYIEGHSKDNTWEEIKKELTKKHSKKVSVDAYKQTGIGKANAVRFGLKKASGEILMIYDSDMTVDPKDLKKFYEVLASGKGEFANGSRMVYPMEKDAMRTLNKVGNAFFGSIFTWIFGQKFKDTLCGTKAFFKKDYLKFKRFKDDPFGDFELIFGAISNNLKVVEIPVRYKERIYGSTNINRFKHGFLLFKITWLAFKTFKAW